MLTAGSPDGLRWSFFWMPKTVPANLNGFILKKRREKERQWSVVAGPISFELSSAKSYENLGLTNETLLSFREEIDSLFQSGKLKQIDNSKLVSELQDSEKLQEFKFGISINYNVARAAGLGCDDSDVQMGIAYEYGLFLMINQKEQSRPVATFRLVGGEKFFFNRIYDFNVRLFTNKRNVQLLWRADQQTLNLFAHRGFNVYRRNGDEWIKINPTPVIQRNPDGFYSVYDSSASPTEVNEYSIRLISFFNFEDSENFFKYDPNEIIETYEKPEILQIIGNLSYDQGILLNFKIAESVQRHIDRFEIWRALPPGPFTKIGVISDPNTYSYNDKGPLIPKEYYAYRIKAVYKDQTEISSDEVMFYYLPKIVPPRPKNLRATVRTQNMRTFITLEWEKGNQQDTITQEFYIYASHPLSNDLRWINFEEAIRETRFVYEVPMDQGATYRFCVSSLGKYMYESEPSDTITVKVASKVLPVPIIKRWEVDSNTAMIYWEYPDVSDLKGFRIYRDGMLIITENDLSADRRSFYTGPMRYFSQYRFEIEAISHDGMASMRSVPVEIVTEKKKKQVSSN
ncbi:MAG: hypothetical protein ACK4EX_10905 [Thermaurantimonas sp.]|nr:hypothetical protein [Thermaurantimonas aggregans]MCX8148691.1 hypothetical protein [Thermaurantimonas aggregans]